MRKYILLIILFVCACVPRARMNSTLIVCLGDSITKGEGVSGEESYPAILAQLLKRKVVNAGVTGDTTFGVLDRLERDVVALNPAIVIIEIGGNDYLRGVPMDRTLGNLERIIVRLKKTGAKIFLCDIASTFLLTEYRGPYKELALRTGVVFMPEIMEGILEDTNNKSDVIHPNARGYRLIAERVYRQLVQYYRFEK